MLNCGIRFKLLQVNDKRRLSKRFSCGLSLEFTKKFYFLWNCLSIATFPVTVLGRFSGIGILISYSRFSIGNAKGVFAFEGVGG